MPDVAGNEGQIIGGGHGGNLKVRLEPGRPFSFGIRLDPAEDAGAIPVERKEGQPGKIFVMRSGTISGEAGPSWR